MQDERGVYYYPNPHHRSVRMYVKREAGSITFRMYSSEEAAVWEKHGWVPHEAIAQAAALYENEGRGKADGPLSLYDLNVAEAVLIEAEKKA